jgi:hypothetical protein
MNRKHLVLVICAALVSASSIAPAEKNSFTCTNKYQNSWCESRDTGQRVSPVRATHAPAHADSVTAQCSAQGKDSLKISRARAAGASAKQQLANLHRRHPSAERTTREKRLIEAVYARHGSPASIRKGIEAQCMAQSNPMRQALLLAALAGRLMPDAQPDAAELEEADAQR